MIWRVLFVVAAVVVLDVAFGAICAAFAWPVWLFLVLCAVGGFGVGWLAAGWAVNDYGRR